MTSKFSNDTPNKGVLNREQGAPPLLSHKAYAALSLIQAGCINAIGILSIFSGVPQSLALLLMFAQGVHLVFDVRRTELSLEASEAQLAEMRWMLKKLKIKEKCE